MTPWQLNAIYSFPARLSLDDMWKGLTLFAPWSNPIWSVRMVNAPNRTPPLHQPPLVCVPAVCTDSRINALSFLTVLWLASSKF